MKAQFPGTCAACTAKIAVGQNIMRVKEGKGYRHVDCQDPWAEVKLKNPDAPATPAQYERIGTLAKERVVPDEVAAKIADDETGLTMQQASDIMDALINAPKLAEQQLPGPDVVPAGRYAVVLELNGEKHDFLVRVWRGDRNPNYVRCYNDDTGGEVDKKDALRRIAEAGPLEAAQRYGKLRRRCSRCGLKLRNRLSVELSIGPECIKYWVPSEARVAMMKDKARAAIRARGEDPNETVVSILRATPGQLEMETQP